MKNYEISELIRKHLKLRKMTQKELASILGVEKVTLNRWCRGKSLPDSNTFLNIANVLNIDLNNIMLSQEDHANEQKLIKIYESFAKDVDRNNIVDIADTISKMVNK